MKWISVKDRMPENDDEILISGNGYVWVGYYREDSFWTDQNMPIRNITHWMPIVGPEVDHA